MGDIIGKEGAELFIVEGAALVPSSKYKLILKDNSDIIHYGKSSERHWKITGAEAQGALELKNR